MISRRQNIIFLTSRVSQYYYNILLQYAKEAGQEQQHHTVSLFVCYLSCQQRMDGIPLWSVQECGECPEQTHQQIATCRGVCSFACTRKY